MDVPILNLIQQHIESQFNIDDLVFYGRVDVQKHVSKKNNRPIFKGSGGRPFIGKSAELKTAEAHLVSELRKQAHNQGIIEPIKHDLWAVCFLYFDNFFVKDSSRRSKKINDLSNLLELPMDCLEEAGVIENDSQICSFDMSRRFPGNSNFIEIFLLKYEDMPK